MCTLNIIRIYKSKYLNYVKRIELNIKLIFHNVNSLYLIFLDNNILNNTLKNTISEENVYYFNI
jgi:hypothetical protein